MQILYILAWCNDVIGYTRGQGLELPKQFFFSEFFKNHSQFPNQVLTFENIFFFYFLLVLERCIRCFKLQILRNSLRFRKYAYMLCCWELAISLAQCADQKRRGGGSYPGSVQRQENLTSRKFQHTSLCESTTCLFFFLHFFFESIKQTTYNVIILEVLEGRFS